MRKIVTILFLTLFTSVFFSCRFSKPLFSKLIKVDTTRMHDSIMVIKSYDYFRPSHYGLYGFFFQTKIFADNGTLILLEMEKRSTKKEILDGRQTHKDKYLKFKNDKIYEKGEYIFRVRGPGGRLALSKTFLYDNNGKLIKKNNNKKIKN